MTGHTSIQRPQRIHGDSRFAATWSFVKQVRAEEFFMTGMSRENNACPIIGPPEIIFSGSSLKPPAASRISAVAHTERNLEVLRILNRITGNGDDLTN